MTPDRHARTMLPIPDRPAPGLTTYDAKDPDTAFPPIEPLLPPAGAPNVLDRAARRRGLRGVERVRRAVPDADRGPAGGGRADVQPVPHHGAVRADPRGAADRPQPPLGRDGQHHRDGDVGARQQLAAAEHEGAAGDDAEAERLLDGPVRQVPRGAGVAVVADGPVRRLAVGRRRVRDLLRVHRRREQPVGPGAVRRHDAGRAAGDARGGLPPHRGPGRPRRELGAPAEGADAGQAVLRVLRAGRHARPAPRAQGVGRQVRGPVRRRLGRAARAHLRPPEGARRHPGRRRAHRAARRDPGLGRHARRAQAGAGARDGGVRRVPGAHRPPRRPADRRHRRPRRPRRHDRLLHHRRQRRLRRGHHERRLQRDGQLQRDGRARDARVHGRARWTSSAPPSSYNHYAVGWAWAMDTPFQWTKQVASHWGGTRNGTIVHWPNGIEERGGLRSQFTHVIDVAPTILEAAGLPEPTMVNGVQQSPMEGTSMLYTFNERRRPGAPRPAVLRDVRQPRHLPQGLERGHQAPHPVGHGRRRDAGVRRRRLGALRRQRATTARRTTSPPSTPEMLAKLQRLWLIEATKYNVLPHGRPHLRAARADRWPGGRR